MELERSVVETVGYEMDALVVGWCVVFTMPYDVLHSWQCRRGHVRHYLLEDGEYDSDVTVWAFMCFVHPSAWSKDAIGNKVVGLSGFSVVGQVMKRLEVMDPICHLRSVRVARLNSRW